MSAAAETGLVVTRQSIVSRRREERERLLRLAIDPEGRPIVDILGRAPGRGVYVEPEALAEALAPKAMGRAFRGRAKGLGPGEIDALVASTRVRLEARVVELLGLCRRAGGLTVGMDAVLGELERGTARVLVLARDLSERSRERVLERAGARPRFEVGTVESLGRALGREAVGVMAIGHPVFAERVRVEAERLEKLGTRGGGAEQPMSVRDADDAGRSTRGKTTDG